MSEDTLGAPWHFAGGLIGTTIVAIIGAVFLLWLSWLFK
jgi:hypothetical protein